MPLSIITAVHNSLAMNQLYWECLVENTTSPFELIIIDNHSTDGSENFFAGLAEKQPPNRIKYIRNEFNQSYPRSMIQAMPHASFPILCFFNNDIWLPYGWNAAFEQQFATNTHLVLSPSGQEAQPTQALSNKLKRKWKYVDIASKLLSLVCGISEYKRVRLALRWMYGNFDHFTNPTPENLGPYFHGIKGDAVVFHKDLLNIVPEPWHERIEAADWHLYLTLAKLHEQDKSIPLPRVLTNVYVHHFGRYSAKKRKEGFAVHAEHKLSEDTTTTDTASNETTTIETYWGSERVRQLWWGYHLPVR